MLRVCLCMSVCSKEQVLYIFTSKINILMHRLNKHIIGYKQFSQEIYNKLKIQLLSAINYSVQKLKYSRVNLNLLIS